MTLIKDKTALDKTYVETPPEIIDFLIESIRHVAKKNFGKDLEDPDVKILDPFAGKGEFFVRGFETGKLNNRMNLEAWELSDERHTAMLHNFREKNIKAKTRHIDTLATDPNDLKGP